MRILNLQSPGGNPANTIKHHPSAMDGYIIFLVIAILVVTVIIAYWITHKFAKKKTTYQNQETQTTPPIAEKQDANDLCAKIHRLDPADLSKADGYIEALLSAEKYSQKPSSDSSRK